MAQRFRPFDWILFYVYYIYEYFFSLIKTKSASCFQLLFVYHNHKIHKYWQLAYGNTKFITEEEGFSETSMRCNVSGCLLEEIKETFIKVCMIYIAADALYSSSNLRMLASGALLDGTIALLETGRGFWLCISDLVDDRLGFLTCSFHILPWVPS